ncbi:MAG: class I SAM-dependent methyltransferase [Verrucomicrobiales bacterium]
MQDLIEKARHRRRGMIGAGTDAFRLFDGAGDGLPGVFIDVLAGHWLVQTRDRDFPEGLTVDSLASCRSLWWKRLERSEREAPRCLGGDGPAGEFAIYQNGCRFLLDFTAGYSQGIFLDQRLNRARVSERCGRGSRILNLFAYTCAFSVVAAAAGAETASVDLSGRYLEWGKRNFAANDLEPSAHGFVRGDALAWLRRWGKKGTSFDGVILDPPTFSRSGKGKVFRVEKDSRALAALAAGVLAPRGWILFSSNCRSLLPDAFQAMVLAGLADAGREVSGVQARPMPGEYRGEKYLKSLWIEVA